MNLCIERGHTAESWEPFAVAIASEKHATLEQMLWQSGVEAATRDGLAVQWRDRVHCVFVLCGDHMLHVAMGSADSPSAKQEGHRLCPYCNATPDEVRLLVRPPPGLWPLRTEPRPGELPGARGAAPAPGRAARVRPHRGVAEGADA